MFYIKTEHEGKQVQIELYGDEIHTTCFICGKEFVVDEELLIFVLQDGDFQTTKVSCGCNAKPRLTRIK